MLGLASGPSRDADRPGEGSPRQSPAGHTPCTSMPRPVRRAGPDRELLGAALGGAGAANDPEAGVNDEELDRRWVGRREPEAVAEQTS